MNLQRPRNSNFTAPRLRGHAPSRRDSHPEAVTGNAHDESGFIRKRRHRTRRIPANTRNLEQTIGQSNSHVNSSCGAVSSSRIAAFSNNSCEPQRLCLQIHSTLSNRNSAHFALRIFRTFPVTPDPKRSRKPLDSRLSQMSVPIPCQEADFLHPSQIVGTRGALPRVFASVII